MSKGKVNPAWKIGLEMAFLKKFFPNGVVKNKTGGLVWEFDLQPTPLSNVYKIRLKYKVGSVPEVCVIAPYPLLKCAGKEDLPHVYSSIKQNLCLFYPRNYEWNEGMKIAETIIPWTAEWLLYYEIWLATGEWCGGGIHIDDNEKAIRNR